MKIAGVIICVGAIAINSYVSNWPAVSGYFMALSAILNHDKL